MMTRIFEYKGIKVKVNDGRGTRNETISSSDGYLDLLAKVCFAMKLPTVQVDLAYEAPWSAKSAKRRLRVISQMKTMSRNSGKHITTSTTRRGGKQVATSYFVHATRRRGVGKFQLRQYGPC